MGACKFCGQEAGFLRNKHRECEATHQHAQREIVDLIRRQGTEVLGVKYLLKDMQKLAQSSYIDHRTFQNLLVTGWEEVAKSALRKPHFDGNEIVALLELAERLDVPEYKVSHILLAPGWARLVDETLQQPTIDESDLVDLSQLAQRLNIPQYILDESMAFNLLNKKLVIDTLRNRRMPKEFLFPGQNPFNLQKSEKLIWAFSNVLCREWQMTYPATMDGWGNVRDAHYHWVNADTGVLGITTRHVYFLGLNRGTVLRHNYDTIVMFEPLPDGVGLRFDPLTNFPPMRYATGDGHFTHTLLSALAQRI